MDKPHFDYTEWKDGPKSGYRSPGNHRYRTQDLFIEFNQTGTALYTLSEEEVLHNGKWYPSAHAIYVHSYDDYDAGVKLVGNRRQWETLKKSPWFVERIESWEAEQKERRASALREVLMQQVYGAEKDSDVRAAAKLLIDMDKGKETKGKVGRPKEAPKPSPKKPDEDDSDQGRVLDFMNKGRK